MYKCEDNKSMSGTHVKLTFTFSAMGTCFPLVSTVSGLTEIEMPTGKEFIHVTVPGLCIGGGGVNINNQEVSHLLFMRNTKGAKKKRFRWYQQEILVPGINDQCKRFANIDTSTMGSIPDKITAVTYCYGDFSQINAIHSSINLFTNNKVIENKQHASWSGFDQPANLAKVFKLIKNMLPSHTVKNIPAERCPMKALMLNAFKEKLQDLNLAPNKRQSLVDFILTLLVMATKACMVKNIQHGFIETGMIGDDNLRHPVFDKIIATCRRNPSVEEYKNIENNMSTIIYESCEFGHISEDVYNHLNVIRDRDSMGHEVMQDATISQESYHRTKCLTHKHQTISERKGYLRIRGLRINKRSCQIVNIMRRSIVTMPLLNACARNWNLAVFSPMQRLEW